MKNILKHTLFIISILIFSNIIYAQAPVIEWEKSIGSSTSEHIYGAHKTDDGGFVMGGYTSSGYTDFYLLKTDGNGDVVWERTFGLDDRSENAWFINSTSDGGTIMAGACDGNFPYPYNSDVYLVKTDADGIFQWDSQIGYDSISESCSSIMQTLDGGFIICGSIWAVPETGWDAYLIKTDSNGVFEWREEYDFEMSADRANSVVQTSDGGYVIAGGTQAFSVNYGYNAYILKTDALGNEIWLKTYGYPWPQEEDASHIIQTSDNGFLICGKSSEDGLVNKDWYVVKTNENGDSLWQRRYGGTYQEGAQYACETSIGEFAITGTMYIDGDWQAFMMKYSLTGDTVWTQQWGTTDYTQNEYWIDQTADNGYIVAGNTNTEANGFDVHLTKFHPETTGIKEFNQNISLIKVSPNPTSNTININYILSTKGEIKINIFDTQGEMKMSLLSKYQESGSHQRSFNIGNLPNGIYFCVLELEGVSQVEKICVLH